MRYIFKQRNKNVSVLSVQADIPFLSVVYVKIRFSYDAAEFMDLYNRQPAVYIQYEENCSF